MVRHAFLLWLEKSTELQFPVDCSRTGCINPVFKGHGFTVPQRAYKERTLAPEGRIFNARKSIYATSSGSNQLKHEVEEAQVFGL
jgi:hypothetical protein